MLFVVVVLLVFIEAVSAWLVEFTQVPDPVILGGTYTIKWYFAENGEELSSDGIEDIKIELLLGNPAADWWVLTSKFLLLCCT